MSAPDEEFYSEERWGNWLDRLRDEDLDPEEEESARLLLNLQDDVAIAVAKVLRAHDEDDLDADAALEELAGIRELVLDETGIDDEETAMFVENIQLRLVPVFAAAEQFLAEGVADDGSADDYLRAASDAESEEDFDRALGLAAAAGTRVIDGEEVDMATVDDLEWHVTEWTNGLDSLQSALSDPEVVEEEDGED